VCTEWACSTQMMMAVSHVGRWFHCCIDSLAHNSVGQCWTWGWWAATPIACHVTHRRSHTHTELPDLGPTAESHAGSCSPRLTGEQSDRFTADCTATACGRCRLNTRQPTSGKCAGWKPVGFCQFDAIVMYLHFRRSPVGFPTGKACWIPLTEHCWISTADDCILTTLISSECIGICYTALTESSCTSIMPKSVSMESTVRNSTVAT
jgi:hypothetical protein